MLFIVVAMVARAVRRRPRAEAYRDDAHRTDAYRDAPSVATAQMLRAELSVLADDVIRLEPQVGLEGEAHDRLRGGDASLLGSPRRHSTKRARQWTWSGSNALVDEATWSMARAPARATLGGRPPPGPPTTLQHPGSRDEPAIELDAGERPAYVESAASYGSGWFAAGGGGLIGGLLMGTMLGEIGGWVDDEDRCEVDDARWPNDPFDDR